MILMECNNIVLGSFLYFFKNFLTLVWIVGPILAIISLTINIIQMLREPENKKTPKKIWNSVVALVVLFMIPTIINAAMALVDDKSEISACWKGDITKPDTNASYINPYTDEQQSIISDPSGYEVGSGGGSGSADDMQVTSCGNLEYCNKFLTSCYNNSRRLSDAIAKYQPPVEYNYGDSKKTWAEAIKAAQNRKLVATTCVVPTNWCVTDAIGKHKTLNSVGYGGFQGYSGPITNYTKQYKFNCTMSVKTAIQKGMILPGDIIGVKAHTFSIYSVDQKTGSAVVFDGGHRFTTTCKKTRCSTMINYSARSNASMKLCQLIRWVK